MTYKASSFPLSARLGLWISTTTIRRLFLPSLAIEAISTYTCFLSRIGNKLVGAFSFEETSAWETVGLAGGDSGGRSLSEIFPEFGTTNLPNRMLIRCRLFKGGLISPPPPVKISYSRPRAESAIG